MVYLCLSSSSDEHLFVYSFLGTGLRFGLENKFFHYRASFGSSSIFWFWWEQHHDAATSGTACSDIRNSDNSSPVCVGKYVTYRITIRSIFLKDLETEDPQLVAEPRGTKPWKGNGKELMRTQ